MITFLANLLRNQNIYATKIIGYSSMFFEQTPMFSEPFIEPLALRSRLRF